MSRIAGPLLGLLLGLAPLALAENQSAPPAEGILPSKSTPTEDPPQTTTEEPVAAIPASPLEWWNREITEPLGSAVTEHLKNFASGLLDTCLAALPGLATAAIILFATRWLARLVDRVVRSMGDDDNTGAMTNDTAKATRRISIACIWIIGVVLAYPYLPGSGSDAFKGISVLLGLMSIKP